MWCHSRAAFASCGAGHPVLVYRARKPARSPGSTRSPLLDPPRAQSQRAPSKQLLYTGARCRVESRPSSKRNLTSLSASGSVATTPRCPSCVAQAPRRDCRPQRRGLARAVIFTRNVKFTGLTQILGQLLASNKCFHSNIGPAYKIWVKPVDFTLEPSAWQCQARRTEPPQMTLFGQDV